MPDADKFRSLVERGLALVARGRVIDREMERIAREGGSGTPTHWAAEAYDVLLAEWEKDAKEALR